SDACKSSSPSARKTPSARATIRSARRSGRKGRGTPFTSGRAAPIGPPTGGRWSRCTFDLACGGRGRGHPLSGTKGTWVAPTSLAVKDDHVAVVRTRPTTNAGNPHSIKACSHQFCDNLTKDVIAGPPASHVAVFSLREHCGQ